jgi:hypothetical protein
MGRQFVMLSGFPPWDARIGHGQRSGAFDWSAVVLLKKACALAGDRARALPPLPVFVAGKTGAMSVPGHIVPAHIEKVVATVDKVVGDSLLSVEPMAAWLRGYPRGHSGWLHGGAAT